VETSTSQTAQTRITQSPTGCHYHHHRRPTSDSIHIPNIGGLMAYSKELWEEIKAEYESGQYESLDKAYAAFEKKKGVKRTKVGKFYKNSTKIPTLESVRFRAKMDKWDKYRYEDAIEARQANSAIERFAKVGLVPEEVARYIAGGVRLASEDSPSMRRIEKFMSDAKEEGGVSGTMFPFLRGLIDDLLQDYRTALGYIREYNEMTGGYAPRESKVTNKHTGSVAVEDNRSSEDIARNIVKILADLGVAKDT
jgi:hypothetical protein